MGATSGLRQSKPRHLALDLIKTSRYDRYMPYYTIFAAVWSTLLAGALQLKEARNSVSVEHIFTQAILTSLHCLLLCGAGNTWNDLVDRDIDARVARTKARPLASGRISTVEALAWMTGQYALSVNLLGRILDGQKIWTLLLPLTASIIVYPYLKRPVFRAVFIYPQYVLGFAVSYPAIIGWASINRQDQSAADIVAHCAPILLLVFFWCFYFNTAYSFQDSIDDRKMQINSAYVAAGSHIRLFLSFLSILPVVTIPFVVSKIGSPWLWLSWMGVWCCAIMKQILQFDSKKPESGARIHWENFLLGLWTVLACMVEVCLQKGGFWIPV
ncbi:UbiA prenyltransferase family-domain-containing protein [Aspergillus floccosus]